MNNLMKALSIAILNFCIMMTLVLSPIPFSRINSAIAAETEQKNCDDGKLKEGEDPKIYQAGCEFNKALATSKVKDYKPEGIKGIVEQFVAAAFAMVGVGLFLIPKPQTITSCGLKSATGAAITFPIVQASSLAYLLGEVAANKAFEKASKIAVDSNFAAKADEAIENDADTSLANREKNNKQIAAYNALIKVYEGQVGGLDKKIKMATLAELGLLVATGIEISDMLKLGAMCEGSKDAVWSVILPAETALGGACSTAIAANTSTCAAIPLGAGAPCVASCAAGGTTIATYLGLNIEQQAVTAGANTEKAAGNESEVLTQIGEAAVFVAKIPVNIITGIFSPILGLFTMGEAEDAAQSTVEEGEEVGNPTVRTPVAATIAAETATGTADGCEALAAACLPAVEAIEAAKLVPIQCCGSSTVTPATADSVSLIMSLDNSQSDKVATPVVASSKSDQRNKFLKPILENMIHRIVKANFKQDSYIDNPQRELAQQAEIGKMINYLMDNQEKIWKESKYNAILADFNKKFEPDSKEGIEAFSKLLAQMRSELTIASANANAWKDLLNIGVKAVILYFALWSTLEDVAFPRPRTRAWTWGIFAAINGAVLMFDKKSQGEAKKRLEIVKEEKKKFLESHMLKTDIVEAPKVDDGIARLAKNGSGGNNSDFDGGTSAYDGANNGGVASCATPSGDGFAPAPCPSKIPEGTFNLPLSDGENIRETSGQFSAGLATLNTGINAAATGGVDNFLKNGDGTLRAAQTAIPALKKLNAKLIDDFDKFNNDNLDRADFKGERLTLKSSIGKIKKIFPGTSKNSITTEQLNKGTKELEKKEKGLKKPALAKFKPFVMPSFNSPSYKSGSSKYGKGNTSVGSGSTSTKGAENLNNFKVNAGEISENDSASIFKLISNRYIRSYDLVFDQKKPEKKPQKE